MKNISQQIAQKSQELSYFLMISKQKNQELAGAYQISSKNNEEGIDLTLQQDIEYGDERSVKNINLVSGNYIPFHTHLIEYSPPSGDDIISLLYHILHERAECAIVVDSKNIYIYKPKIFLMTKLIKIINISDNENNTIESWKKKLSENVDMFAYQYHVNKNEKKYIKSMSDLNIYVKIIPLF